MISIFQKGFRNREFRVYQLFAITTSNNLEILILLQSLFVQTESAVQGPIWDKSGYGFCLLILHVITDIGQILFMCACIGP